LAEFGSIESFFGKPQTVNLLLAAVVAPSWPQSPFVPADPMPLNMPSIFALISGASAATLPRQTH
jgi:hypothetical protein